MNQVKQMKVENNEYRNLVLKVAHQTSMGNYGLMSKCVETTG